MKASSGMTCALVVGLSVCSCVSGQPLPTWAGGPSPSPSAQLAGPAPTSSSPQAMTRAQQEQQATSILDRAQTIYDKADAAIQLDGSPQAAQVRNAVRSCRGPKDACIQVAQNMEAQSKTGMLAGLAGYLAGPVGSWVFSRSHGMQLPLNLQPILKVGPDLDFAEQAVAKAMEAAQAAAAARAAQQTAKDAESQAINNAASACNATPTNCRNKCDSANDGPSCFAWGAGLQQANPPKLADARTYYVKACNVGLQTGCAAVSNVDKLLAQAAAQVDSAWGDVTDAGDDLATKMHMVTVAQQVGTARLVRNLPAMRAMNAAIVTEKYCPARKAFLAVSNATEFVKRAAAHCKDQAPTATGLSGAQVTLTAECQQVYATVCP
jgi:hypothetical protein